MRYSNSHNLMVAVPKIYNYFGHPDYFQGKMVQKLKLGSHYNIFTYHTRYNYQALKRFMPTDTVFITILREPTSLFESVYDFYYLPWLLNMTLTEFVSQNSSNIRNLNRRATLGRIGRNQMSFDLGFSIEHFEDDDDHILKMAQTLDNQFDLVMITERMNESLVLLKNLLCWTTEDVLTFKLNARKESSKTPLTPDLKNKILKWNRSDKILYDYFVERFDQRVEVFGREKMAAELKELTTKIDSWFKFCNTSIGGSSEFFDNAFKLQAKNMDNSTCKYITLPEMDFSKELLKKQKPYYRL